MVKDLTVIDDPHVPVFIGHGLMSGGREVDDAEPAMGQFDAGFAIESVVVRAAMPDDGSHALQHPGILAGRVSRIDEAGNPTHKRSA
jgi:hypothetical protein